MTHALRAVFIGPVTINQYIVVFAYGMYLHYLRWNMSISYSVHLRHALLQDEREQCEEKLLCHLCP